VRPVAYHWHDADGDHTFELVFVRGTHGAPFAFGGDTDGVAGNPPSTVPVEISNFFIASVPVTQRLWTHIVGTDANPAVNRGRGLPLENVSWDELTTAGGFPQRVNDSPLAAVVSEQLRGAYVFRLPSETEWEYAARGGPHWATGFRFSGSDDIDAVAWYDRRHGDHSQPVARKAPNQLGIFDMSGNVWEWCEDAFTRDIEAIPRDGTTFVGPSHDRVLRGGCFHNWARHCTVSKRYEIARDFHDG
jgi:formylglycine-generating enzyme required for sulfatase activity